MLEKIEKSIGLLEKLQKLGFPLSLLLLLGGAAYVYWYHWEWVTQHQLLTAIIVALYVASLLLLTFIKGVLSFTRDLWKEEFRKDALKVTATWLRAFPGKFAPGFPRRYNRQVIIDNEVFNVRGLGLISSFTLKLEKVFVELKISPSGNPNKVNPDPIAIKALDEARTIWDFIHASRDQTGGSVALAIVGPPGCGKSTLLQHVAVTLAANRQRRYGLSAYTPILLNLREHATLVTAEPTISLGSLAQRHFAGASYPELKPPLDWFERQLRRGKGLILLDGLDEVAQASKRMAVSRWVDQQLRNYPECRFVVTSRPQGYQDAPLEKANVVEVQPFSARQVNKFIESWYLANEIVSAGNKEDEGVRQRANREADDLSKRLADPKAAALNALTVNPLLLTMIAMVHRYRGALPGSRVELYREICEVLLGRWRQAKGVLDDILTADQKRLVLMPLAARMMEREVREISAADALAIIRPPLRRVGVSGEAAKNFLGGIQASSGLLLERENGLWSFAHLTFQEYLTAVYWLEVKSQPADWVRLVENSWWHETLRLYAAQGDATPILEGCLTANSLASLILAAEIMEEGPRAVNEDVRNMVEDRLTTALESTDQALRRLAAEVLLSRRVSLARSSSMQRIDDTREIDSEYITCAEYQLFLDAARERNKYFQPDHWVDHHFTTGQASAPLCGIRMEHAQAFCDWLTRRQGAGTKYRLPTEDESRQYPASPSEMGAWCLNESLVLTEAREEELRRQIPLFVKPISDCNLDLDLSRALSRAQDVTRKYFSIFHSNGYYTITTAISLLDALDFAGLINHDRALSLAQTKKRALALAHSHSILLINQFAKYLALDLIRDLDLELNILSDRALGHDPDRASARASNLARALACALDLDFTLDLNLNRGRDRARALARMIGRDLTHAYTLGHGRDRDRARDHVRRLVRNLIQMLNRASDCASDLTSAVASDLASDLAHASARDLNQILDLGHLSAHALNLARSLVLFFDLNHTLRYDRNHGRLNIITHELAVCATSIDQEAARLVRLISDLMNIGTADTIPKLRMAERQYVARLLEALYVALPQVEQGGSIWRRGLGTHDKDFPSELCRRAIADASLWLHIIAKREQGLLPAWEGIRILRERVS